MKKIPTTLAAALIPVFVAFLISGCGGAAAGASNPPTAASHAAGASAKASPTDKPENLIGQAVSPTNQSPSDFQNSVKERRPVVVTFYMTGAADDNYVRTAITDLESQYTGQVDFEDYLFSDASSFGDLTSLLKVNTTPSVIMINKQAKVQRAWTGYVDKKSLQQGITEIISG